mmetsp:Transcript_15345/g.18673  ORF Transcript_15345/g.18673 Transcript_15345/m.18673 type:complete len:214 (-) Transcript_15345:40-681(-)
MMKNRSCNLEMYHDWYHRPYERDLSDAFLFALVSADRSHAKLWKIMNFDETRDSFFNFKITNGQVMEVSGLLCKTALSKLNLDLAGQHGPIEDHDIHDVMCNPYCTLSDSMRNEALNHTTCNCIQLSLSQSAHQYRDEGSFCRENTGEYLCAVLGKCGIWQCELSDFGCKRLEYNQIEVPLRGYGHVCNVASNLNCDIFFFSLLFVLTVIFSF